jgi:hypothetical protein
MNRLLSATLAALALSFTACSDRGDAYTPVDAPPAARDDGRTGTGAGTDATTAAGTAQTETGGEFTSEPEVTPLHEPAPTESMPTDPLPPPTDPENPPMDPVPRAMDDAVRPPPVDPAMEDEKPVTPRP